MRLCSVCMTDDPTDDPTEKMKRNDSLLLTECPGDAISTSSHSELLLAEPSPVETEEKEFQWSKSLQGLLLGCFFYGYILTQIIGGYFSDKVRTGSVFVFTNPCCCSLSLVASPSSWWEC